MSDKTKDDKKKRTQAKKPQQNDLLTHGKSLDQPDAPAKDHADYLMAQVDDSRDEYDELLDSLSDESPPIDFDDIAEPPEEESQTYENPANEFITGFKESLTNDDVAPFDERHRFLVDRISRDYHELLKFSLPGPSANGLPPSALTIEIGAVDFLRTLREIVTITKCVEPELLMMCEKFISNPELAKSFKRQRDFDPTLIGFPDESAMEDEMLRRQSELVFDERVLQAERDAFFFFVEHLPTIVGHAYTITVAMASEQLLGRHSLLTEKLRRESNMEEFRRGSQAAVLKGAVQNLISDIKRILHSRPRGGSQPEIEVTNEQCVVLSDNYATLLKHWREVRRRRRQSPEGNWRDHARLDETDTPDDLLDQLCDLDPYRRQPSALAHEHAARRSGIPANTYGLSSLSRLRRRGDKISGKSNVEID